MDVPSGGEEVGGRTFRQDEESPLSPQKVPGAEQEVRQIRDIHPITSREDP